MRKKYLINLLSVGLEGKEQWKTLGRLEELRSLSTNINTAKKESMKQSKKVLADNNKK